MIVTFFRSSSFTAWDFCEARYYWEYGLGLPSDSNKKAAMGSITHKGLELLARKKLAQQRGEKLFKDDEVAGEWVTETFKPEDSIRIAWDHYTKGPESHHDWKAADLRQCTRWMWVPLEYRDGMFSPEKREVVLPEQYFDFEIEEDWAKFSFLTPDDELVDGYLGMKGTVDLICTVPGRPNCLELIDWKTGQRLDWATGEEKDFWKLLKDPQLRIYHYALSRLYPEIDQIFISIYYVRAGGPFTIPLTRDDLPETERMIRERFETIHNNKVPDRIIFDEVHKWKCFRLCHYGRNKFPGSDKSICSFLHQKIRNDGLDAVMTEYANWEKLTKYGSGGGRSED